MFLMIGALVGTAVLTVGEAVKRMHAAKEGTVWEPGLCLFTPEEMKELRESGAFAVLNRAQARGATVSRRQR